MKKTLRCLTILAALSLPIISYSSGNSGRIHFVGSVVEGGCSFSSINSNNLNSHCYYSNKPDNEKNENLSVNIEKLMKNTDQVFNTERYSMNAIQNQKAPNLYNIRVNYY